MNQANIAQDIYKEFALRLANKRSKEFLAMIEVAKKQNFPAKMIVEMEASQHLVTIIKSTIEEIMELDSEGLPLFRGLADDICVILLEILNGINKPSVLTTLTNYVIKDTVGKLAKKVKEINLGPDDPINGKGELLLKEILR